jgi:hypothetical protein
VNDRIALRRVQYLEQDIIVILAAGDSLQRATRKHMIRMHLALKLLREVCVTPAPRRK